MKVSNALTNFPLQITFRNVKPLPQAENWIRAAAAKLETFYQRIMGCRVAIGTSKHHREGNPYHVRIDLTLPGGKLVVMHEPNPKTRARQTGEAQIRKRLEAKAPSKDLRLSINEAFRVAGRRLQDYGRRQNGYMKHNQVPPTAKVSRLFPDKGYGFLVTPEGREIYFHKDSVLNQAFGRLAPGSIVRFAEEAGDKGPQASTVRLTAKKRIGRVKEQPAV